MALQQLIPGAQRMLVSLGSRFDGTALSRQAKRPLRSIAVDFNWTRDGLLRAFADDIAGEVAEGDVLRAVDEDGTERLVEVVELRPDGVLGLLIFPTETTVVPVISPLAIASSPFDSEPQFTGPWIGLPV